MIKELNIDIWNEQINNNYRCILTNGFVKRNGELAMRRGVAKEALDKYPWLAKELGLLIKKQGNQVRRVFHYQTGIDMKLIVFPTKHNWWEKSDLSLIRQSAQELVDLLNYFSIKENIYLPRPGCGNGGLSWSLVRPELEKIFKNFSEQIIIVYQ